MYGIYIYGVIWYGVIYSMIYGTIYGVVYGMVWYMVWYNDVVWYGMVWYGTVIQNKKSYYFLGGKTWLVNHVENIGGGGE